MGIDNLFVTQSAGTFIQTNTGYQETLPNITDFNSTALSGSGNITGTDIPAQSLAKMSSGMYNQCWKTSTGFPGGGSGFSFCEMFSAWTNGNPAAAGYPTATQPSSTARTSTPDQYNNSTAAGTYLGAGLWSTRRRYYFAVQVNNASMGTAQVLSPWSYGPATGGQTQYKTVLNGTNTIFGWKNGNVAGGSNNSYNSGAVAADYMTIQAVAQYPNTFSAWRHNSSSGVLISNSATYNLYYSWQYQGGTQFLMQNLNTAFCVFV
jgi:hypothetical protein